MIFNELLSINNEVSVHIKNIQTHLIEVYKNLNGLSPSLMLDLFTKRELHYEKKKNICHGTETVPYKAAQSLELLPYDIKNSASLHL